MRGDLLSFLLVIRLAQWNVHVTQAAMIGYINAFRLYAIVAIISKPLIWSARMPKEEAT